MFFPLVNRFEYLFTQIRKNLNLSKLHFWTHTLKPWFTWCTKLFRKLSCLWLNLRFRTTQTTNTQVSNVWGLSPAKHLRAFSSKRPLTHTYQSCPKFLILYQYYSSHFNLYLIVRTKFDAFGRKAHCEFALWLKRKSFKSYYVTGKMPLFQKFVIILLS